MKERESATRLCEAPPANEARDGEVEKAIPVEGRARKKGRGRKPYRESGQPKEHPRKNGGRKRKSAPDVIGRYLRKPRQRARRPRKQPTKEEQREKPAERLGEVETVRQKQRTSR